MWQLLKDLLIEDDPPEKLGIIGFVILATFSAFCAVVWVLHTPGVQPR